MVAGASFSTTGYGQTYVNKDGTSQTSTLIDGFDMNAQIRAITDAKKKRAEPLTDEIKLNSDKKIPEINDIEKKTRALQETLAKLSGYLGVHKTVPNVLQEKMVEYQANDNSVAIAVDRDASITTTPMRLSVTQLAKKDSIKSQSFTSKTDDLNLTGNLVINGQTVSVTAGMSLKDVQDAVNAVGDDAKVKASILTISNGSISGQAASYKLVIEATEIAKPIVFFSDTDNSVQTGLGLPNSDTAQDSIIAKLVVNGETIIRSSNAINDVFAGVSFSLVKPSTTDTVATVDYNGNLVFETIKEFVNNYNALNDAIIKNEEVDADKRPKDTAVLHGNNLLLKIKTMLSSNMNKAVQGVASTDYAVLSQIGITTNKVVSSKVNDKDVWAMTELSGRMYVDDKILANVIGTKLDKVQKLFGNFATFTNSNFKLWNESLQLNSDLAGKAITVTYKKNLDNSYTAILSAPGLSDVTIDSLSRTKLIEGPAGTVYEGFNIGYDGADPVAGGAAVITTMTITQGLAASFNNDLIKALSKRKVESDPPAGFFDSAVEQLVKSNKELKKSADDIIQSAEDTLKRLSAQTSGTQIMANKTKSILQMLEVWNNQMKRG